MNNNLKYFLIFSLSLIVVISLLTKFNNHNMHKTADYKGVVINKYYDNTKGTHIVPRVVFYSDSIGCEVDILMDNDKTFKKISKGDTITVALDVKDLKLD